MKLVWKIHGHAENTQNMSWTLCYSRSVLCLLFSFQGWVLLKLCRQLTNNFTHVLEHLSAKRTGRTVVQEQGSRYANEVCMSNMRMESAPREELPRLWPFLLKGRGNLNTTWWSVMYPEKRPWWVRAMLILLVLRIYESDPSSVALHLAIGARW